MTTNLLTVPQACKALGFATRQGLEIYIKSGRLKVQTFGTQRMIEKKDLNKLKKRLDQ